MFLEYFETSIPMKFNSFVIWKTKNPKLVGSKTEPDVCGIIFEKSIRDSNPRTYFKRQNLNNIVTTCDLLLTMQ